MIFNTLKKILRLIIIIGVVICIILAVKKSDWSQAIFWLLTFCTLVYVPKDRDFINSYREILTTNSQTILINSEYNGR